MHDIYYGTALPPNRKPIPIVRPDDRIGQPYLECRPEKVVAVVRTDSPDRHTEFKAPDDTSNRIAGHVVDFLRQRGAKGSPSLQLVALAVRRRQHRQRGTRRAGRRPISVDDRLYGGDPGRHVADAAFGHISFASATAFSLSDTDSQNCGPTSTHIESASFSALRRSATIPRSYVGSVASQ